MSNSQWKPKDDELALAAWQEDKNFPGVLFYKNSNEQHLIDTLNTLGRSNPRNATSNGLDGGQAEYFDAAAVNIDTIAIVPLEFLKPDQIAQNPIDPDSQVKIGIEAAERLKKGLPALKCPPIVLLDNSSREFLIQSGHNRYEWHKNTYPGEPMLVIPVPHPKVHSKANPKVATAIAKLAANPSSPTRGPTIEDRALTIQDVFRADPYIHDTKTGIALNPQGTPLVNLDKNGKVWKSVFEYICGKNVHPTTIGKVYKRVTGNSVSRRVRVTNETVFHDLNSLGWETGVLRQENGQVEPDYSRVSWKKHLDHKNKALIIAKDIAGNHFDTAMYPCLIKMRPELQEKGIEWIYLHANLGSSYTSAASLKKAQDDLITQCQAYNNFCNEMLANNIPCQPIKKVYFPKQYKNVPKRLIEFTDDGVEDTNLSS
jgi:hypothetical protein